MSRDLRKYARQTNTRLIIGLIILIFTVGLGLIAIFFGYKAALLGLLCLLGALLPVGLIILLLGGLDLLLKKIKGDE